MNAVGMTSEQLLADHGAALYERAATAVNHVYARLEREWDENRPDAIQAAAAAYWHAHQKKQHHGYAYKAARLEALELVLSGNNPINTLSLDYQGPDDKAPFGETIPYRPQEPDLDDPWLDHVDLVALVRSVLPGPCNRWDYEDSVTYYATILRLLARGYDNAAIAIATGRSEAAIRSARAKIRRLLFAYCRDHNIDTSHIQVKTGGWRPSHHYAHMDNRAANKARWAK